MKGDSSVFYDDTKNNIFIQSAGDLKNLPNLEGIYISNWDETVVFENFDFVKNLPKLKVLICNSSASSLEPLKYCRLLESLELTLYNEEEIDLSALKKCPSLTFIKKYENLKHIGIFGVGRVTNFETLLDMPSLQALGFSPKYKDEIILQ